MLRVFRATHQWLSQAHFTPGAELGRICCGSFVSMHINAITDCDLVLKSLGHSHEGDRLWEPASPLCLHPTGQAPWAHSQFPQHCQGERKIPFSQPILTLFMVIGNRPAGTARIHRKISNFLLLVLSTPPVFLKLITEVTTLRTLAVLKVSTC